MEKIYHYTAIATLEAILTSRVLKVSEWEKKSKVKPPALWLSTNDFWEPTATKAVYENGVIRQLTKDEQAERFGLARFVLPFNKANLCSWKKYRYASNTPLDVYNAMETVGIKQGASPYQWFASFKDIPIKDCLSCEQWDGENWITLVDFTTFDFAS